jgi:molecular chaperone DnaJ
MMPQENHYEVLGVPKTATPNEIKTAFRKLAKKYHPDRNSGSAERFKQVNTAYQILSDSGLRKQYDLAQDPITRFSSVNPANVGDMLRDFINSWQTPIHGPRARTYARRKIWDTGVIDEPEPGTDIEVNLSITLEEAATGCHKPVTTLSGNQYPCDRCKGERSEPSTRKVVCTACSGQGQVMNFGAGHRLANCPACKGHGDHPIVACRNCRGTGKARHKKTVKVHVPPGVNSGTKLRLAGMGSPGVNMPAGDLYVHIIVAPHHRFKREGKDLYVEEEISLKQAVIGGTIGVLGLNDKPFQVSVPPTIKPGVTTIKVAGAGLKSTSDDSKGDLYVILQVKLPTAKTARAQKLVEELDLELSRN